MSVSGTDPKQLIRNELRERLRRIPSEKRRLDSDRICERLFQSPEWTQARTLLLFVPRPDEPDIGPAICRAREQGRTVAVPRFDPATGLYTPALLPAPPEPLRAGPFGIPEPPPGSAGVDPNRLDFTLVPGLGFAPDGRRLGRGRGYFDRLLSSVRGLICGVAFDEQVLDALPVEPHDVLVDCILTPSRWWFSPRPTDPRRC